MPADLPPRPSLESLLARINSDPYTVEKIRQATGFPRLWLFPRPVIAAFRPIAYLMVVADLAPKVLREDWPFDRSAWGPDRRLRAFRNSVEFIHGSARLDGWMNP